MLAGPTFREQSYLIKHLTKAKYSDRFGVAPSAQAACFFPLSFLYRTRNLHNDGLTFYFSRAFKLPRTLSIYFRIEMLVKLDDKASYVWNLIVYLHVNWNLETKMRLFDDVYDKTKFKTIYCRTTKKSGQESC